VKNSPYKMGFIGLRVAALGRARRRLKKEGWMESGRTETVFGFDWMLPVCASENFRTFDWRPLANLGLAGVAVWVTDAQWEEQAGFTKRQWLWRATVEMCFNNKYPEGRSYTPCIRTGGAQ
jgi:hypothetical protein